MDDIDPKSLTDEQRAQLNELYQRDPYTFYQLWRDPAQAQIWAEGADFKTEPVDDYYDKIEALELAGAPEHVVEAWRETLTNNGRNERGDTELFPPATKPVAEKLKQIDELVEYIDSQLNWVENNLEPDEPEDDLPEELPIAGKWTRLMQRAVGNLVVEHHDGTVRHYKETETVQANMGVEVVEISLEPSAKFEIDIQDWDINYIKPDAAIVSRDGDKTIIRLEFFHVYE